MGVGGTWTKRLPGSGPRTEDAPWMIIPASGWLAHSCAIGATGMAGGLSHSGDMTVEWLRLNLRFSHGFISVQNIILASLNHTSIGTVSVNGYL